LEYIGCEVLEYIGDEEFSLNAEMVDVFEKISIKSKEVIVVPSDFAYYLKKKSFFVPYQDKKKKETKQSESV
jgi:hypothetical protein